MDTKTRILTLAAFGALACVSAPIPASAQQLIAWPIGMPNPFRILMPGGPVRPMPLPPRPLPPTRPGTVTPVRPEDGLPLELSGYKVEGTVAPGGAELTYDIAFRNPTDRRLEGVLLIPIPADTVLSGFTMTAGGKTMKGELLDATQARTIYENIVRASRDPGLLELVGERLVRASVFPIEPRATVTVRMVASQAVRSSGGLYQLTVPMRSATMTGSVTRGASVRLRLSGEEVLRSVYSPQAGVEIKREGEKAAEVTYKADGTLSDLDLFFSTARDPLAAGILTHRPEGEEGTVMLSLTPKREAEGTGIPKDLLFIVDRSGSMEEGGKMTQAKAALSSTLKRLGPKDRFGIVDFATGVGVFERSLVAASKENVARALRYVEALEAAGGTNIEGALSEGLPMLAGGGENVPMVFFLTDGLPTVGSTDVQAILRSAQERNRDLKARLFAFGVGDDVNTLLLDKLAEANRGSRDYVRPGEDIEHKVSTLYQKVARPALTDVRLEWDGVSVSQVTPRQGGDLFYGSELLVMGRFKAAGKGKLTVTGKSAGKTLRFEYPVKLPERAERNAFLPRLWANLKVAEELDGIRLSGRADPEVVETITRIAKRYGIVTPYTSYLVLEEGMAMPAAAQAMRREAARMADDARSSGFSGGAGVALRAQNASRLLGGKDAEAEEAAMAAAPGAGGGLRFAPSKMSATRGAFAKAEKRTRDELKAKGERIVETREAGGKSFYLRGGVWVDGAIEADAAAASRKTVTVKAMSDEYFALLAKEPVLGRFFALGGKVKVLHGGTVYSVD
ncbi:MAG: VWA domain-containing protein [Elusimicrobia bacterium]|nr:VWA domain-containing protein [Elusimicrobiota bacterium]